MMGDLGQGSWSHLLVLAPILLISGLGALFFARELNALTLGDEMARHLGISPETCKKWMLFWTTMLTASAVAICGTIGFVGLLVPHALRIIVGPDHRLLLPLSALGGAVFLVGCDVLSRIVAKPLELPIGLVTAAFGAPFFLFLLLKLSRGGKSL